MQSPMLLQVFNLARLLLVLVPVHAAEWLPIVYNSVAGQGFDHHDAALNAAAECSVGKGDVVSLRGVAECLTGVETCFTAAGATAGGIRWGTLPAPCRPHSTTLTTEVTSPVEMGVPTAGGSCPAVDFHVSKDGSIVLVKAIPAGCWGIKLDGMTFDGSKPDDWAWVTVALLLFCGGAWLIVGVAITVRKTEGAEWSSWSWREPLALHPHKEKLRELRELRELRGLVSDGTRLSLRTLSSKGTKGSPL